MVHLNGTNSISVGHEVFPASASRELGRSRLLFCGVCLYLLSQAFTVPVAVVGPSWAVWPTFADFAVVFIAVGRLVAGKWNQTSSPPNVVVLRGFLFFSLVCALSYLVQTVLIAGAKAGTEHADSKALVFGGFALYRTVEFVIVLWGASALPFTPFRSRAILCLSLITFVAVCTGVICTYFSLILPARFAPNLPNDSTSGAWTYYLNVEGEGLGTIGYNHAYVAAQIILLAALSLHLMDSAKSCAAFKFPLLLLGLFSVFLTGSRMGLISMLLFCAVAFWWVPEKLRPSAIIVGLLILGATIAALPWSDPTVDPGSDHNDDIYARQKTLFRAFQRESLSGRDDIWKERLAYLDEKPLRWAVGGGLGATAEAGENAHMQVLQVVSELGLVGLWVWASFIVGVVRSLWFREHKSRVIFWATVCLLVSCVTQDTFYPVPALGHFLGFYLMAVAMALRPQNKPYECPNLV